MTTATTTKTITESIPSDQWRASQEIDQESVCSSEETESPRSVGRWRRKKDEFVHSQVLRIREEDSYLGDDDLVGVAAGKDNKLSVATSRGNSAATLSFVLFSRPVLPCSPLGGKSSSLNALH